MFKTKFTEAEKKEIEITENMQKLKGALQSHKYLSGGVCKDMSKLPYSRIMQVKKDIKQYAKDIKSYSKKLVNLGVEIDIEQMRANI